LNQAEKQKELPAIVLISLKHFFRSSDLLIACYLILWEPVQFLINRRPYQLHHSPV